MSDQLTMNAHGLRLITQFEGAPRLKARLCEGGRWELSYGVTFYPDGAPVQEGDTCTHEEAMAMFRHALSVFEDAVRRNVKVPMNSNQFSAYTIFCYNVGEAQFASSTVLKRINERRYDDAAEAMGAWIYATLGQHKQALRGLARRQYATGCLAMGYDWEVACSDDAIALVRERPPNDIGTDRVLFKTKFTDVLSVAQRYPLPPLDEPELVLTIPASPPQAAEVAQRQPDPARSPAAGATIAKPSATVSGPAEAAGEAGVSRLPPPAPVVLPSQAPKPPRLPDPPVPIGQQREAVDATRNSQDWSSNAKAMWQSRRFWGLVLVLGGRLWMLKTGSNAVLGTVSDPLITEMFSGFMVMIIGEIIQHWGERKATRPLK